MTRLEQTFARLRAQGRKGLIIYLMAGVGDTVAAVSAAVGAGADVIELGMPFSDPLADGPVIQEAGIRAIKGGMNLPGLLSLVRELRSRLDVPLIGMGYINQVMHYGQPGFVADFHAAGMDGLIIPDVPHEESGQLHTLCRQQDFNLIEFVTPGTTPERLARACASANGFIYGVSVNGVTGVRQIDYSLIGRVLADVRAKTDVPTAVGFGIGSPESAVNAAQYADAVIVGSAVVRRLLDGKPDEAAAFIKSLRLALDGGENR